MSKVLTQGVPLDQAEKVAIMIHGRGASAESIVSLRAYLDLDGFALIAPEANGATWYPYSFMAPDEANATSLKGAISKLEQIVKNLYDLGFKSEQIYFIGFSQGACLSLDFAARNAKKYGGVVAFTGGLIGEKINLSNYSGDFNGTQVFIGSSHKDLHVPLHRIQESVKVLEEMGAKVHPMIFQDQEHTIRQDETEWVNKNILS